ncbi:MAG: MFS transporter [Nocardioidaceae bacterium]
MRRPPDEAGVAAGVAEAASPEAGGRLAGHMSQAVSVATATVVPVYLTGGLAVQLSHDLGFPVASLGLAPAAFFGAAAVCSPLAGMLTERVGPGPAMRAAVWLAVVVMVVAAVVVWNLASLLVLLAVAGAGNALAQPSTNLFLAQRVPWRRQGTAYGVKQSAIPTAGLLAGLAVPFLGLTIGWRWAFATMAVLAAVVAWRTPAAGRRPRASAAERRQSGDASRSLLVVAAVAAGLAAASGSALGIYLVAGAVHSGWSEAAAGLLFAFTSTVGIAARLGSGLRADRRGRNHLGIIILMLVLGSAGFALLAPSHRLLFALGAPIAFGAGWGWPGLFILAVVQASPTAPAAATGLTQTGTSVGAVVGPVAFGLIVEHESFGTAWIAAGAAGLVAAAIFLLVRRPLGTTAPPVSPSIPI